MKPTASVAIAVLAAALVSAAATAADAEATHVTRDSRLYPLILDLDANGIPECLYLHREARQIGAGVEILTTTVELLEPLPRTVDYGVAVGGRRYRYIKGGRFVREGVAPLAGFHETDEIAGAVQARLGMLGVVALPLVDPTGRAVTLAIHNTARGAFVFAEGDVALDLVGTAEAQALFARAIAKAGREEPAPEASPGTAIALGGPRGPLP